MKIWLGAVVLASWASHPAMAGDAHAETNCHQKGPDDYFPPQGIRLNQVGTVLVEYSVKDAGPPTDIVVVDMKAPAFFRTAALRVIKLQTCAPTQSWRDNGGAAKRLRINIQFKLRGLDDPPGLLDPDAGVIVITADPIVPMKIHRRA